MVESPKAILYDETNGVQLAVANGVAIPANTFALLSAGSDGTNSRTMAVDTSGRPVVAGAGVAGTPAAGVLSIQGVAGGTAVPISGSVTTSTPTSATATLSNVAASATSVTVLASNASRKGACIANDGNKVLYLKFGATASLTSYTVRLDANAQYEVPFGYTGIIDGIWSSANGSARVTELT
jgi:hypothetical protein